MFDLSICETNMIKRIVVMDLMPGKAEQFIEIFEQIKQDVRNQPGCLGLELLRSAHLSETNVCTLSFWRSVDDLETYRASALFRKTWTDVKPLFASKAQAWTFTTLDLLP